VKTPLVAIAVLATFAGCRDPKPGSPFTTIATPELRAIFTKLCADPVTGSDTPTEWHDPGGDLAIAQSSGYGCSVRLHYDQQDLHITWIYMGAGLDWARFRNFVRGTIEPIVRPPIRAFLEQKVLADLGVDKRVTYSKHGVGEVDYRNRTRDSVDPDLRPTREPMLYLTIAWK